MVKESKDQTKGSDRTVVTGDLAEVVATACRVMAGVGLVDHMRRPLVPVYGAHDIPGARLAAGGVPVWPRSVLVDTPALGAAMAEALGDRPVLELSGHGLVSVAEGPPGTAVASAVLQAYAVDTLARVTLAVLQAGGEPTPIATEDLAGLPDLGGALNVHTLWRYLVRRTGA